MLSWTRNGPDWEIDVAMRRAMVQVVELGPYWYFLGVHNCTKESFAKQFTSFSVPSVCLTPKVRCKSSF
jgi:hypothetical protein